MTESKLSGRRVLVVEDDAMVAMLLQTALEDADCRILGPFEDLATGMRAAQYEAPDAAVLDINLGGEMVFPLAELLDRNGVPFLLLSGYGDSGLPPEKPNWPICAKPFKLEKLVVELSRLMR